MEGRHSTARVFVLTAVGMISLAGCGDGPSETVVPIRSGSIQHTIAYGDSCPERDPDCVTELPTYDEEKEMERLIQGSANLCPWEKDYFLELLYDGRVRMYGGVDEGAYDDKRWGDHHAYPGTRPPEIHINRYHWRLSASQRAKQLHETMFHEAHHGIDPYDDDNATNIWYTTYNSCGGTF